MGILLSLVGATALFIVALFRPRQAYDVTLGETKKVSSLRFQTEPIEFKLRSKRSFSGRMSKTYF
jgi:hypothetical protein